MRAWSAYALVAILVVLVGLAVTSALSPRHTGAYVFAALVALAVQLVAFALLVSVRHHPEWLLAAWSGGVLFRMAALVAVGLWLTDGGPYPALPALLTLVIVLTVLALIEPLALRRYMKPIRSVG